MEEDFVGVKFEANLSEKEVSFSQQEASVASELIEWSKRFSKENLAPTFESDNALRSAGNLSFRFGGGFVITSSGGNFDRDSIKDLVLVTDFDFETGKVYAEGLHNPSSESLIHALVYQTRPDVTAVFHGHDDLILEKADELELSQVSRLPYGSKQLAKEVSHALQNSDFVVMKGHGFVCVGSSIKRAGELTLEVSAKAKG